MTRQPFEFPFFQETATPEFERLTPDSHSYAEGDDFLTMEYAGNVALIQRGTCPFGDKAKNAEAAGATAAIVFNEGQEERTEVLDGTLDAPDVTIPVLGTSFAVGEELATLTDPSVRIFTETSTETRHTENVIADTPGGRANRTVVVGAHLDSVPEGAGINDNGSEHYVSPARKGRRPRRRRRSTSWSATSTWTLWTRCPTRPPTPR